MNSETITIRIEPEVKELLKQLAKEDQRTLSGYVKYILMKQLKQNMMTG